MEEDKQKNTEEKNSEESFDVTGFLLECFAHWKWFVACVVVLAAVALFYCFRKTPLYEVTSAVYIQDNKSDNGNVLLESLGLSPYKNNIDNEIEVFRSKNQITAVVEALGLYKSYAWKSFMRTTPLYGNSPVEFVLDSIDLRAIESPLQIELKPLQGGKFHLKAKTHTPDGDKVMLCDRAIDGLPYELPFAGGMVQLRYTGDTIPVLEKTLSMTLSNPRSVSKAITLNLTVAFASKDATILNVIYRTPVVQEGKDFVSTLVDFYNIDAANLKNRGNEKTQEFIDSRLSSISEELAVVEAQVEAYRSRNNLIDISTEAQLYLEQTGHADGQLAELELQKSLVDYVEEFLAVSENEYMPIPVLGIDNEDFAALINEYNKSLQQRERLLLSSSESNPVVAELTRSVKTQRALLLKGIESIRKGVEIKKRDISKQDRRLEDKIKNVPVYERELSDIIRQQRIKENLYIFLLEKREENSLAKSMVVPVARIIDDPDSTNEPVSPKKILILCAAVLLGLLIPAFVIYLRMVFYPVLKDKKTLERLTSIPILAEISRKPEGKFFVVEKKSVEPIAELFRLVRNNLQFVLTSSDKKVLAVTSSVMHEGKTFIASNMALSFALTGKRVLLMGVDIRRPRLSENFHIPNREGVTTYLSGVNTDLASLIHPSGVDPNLDLLMAGPIPPNPNELLMSKRFDEMIDYARAHYDYVILDTAPLGMVSDTFLLARAVDVVVYVARANYTNKAAIEMLNGWIRSKRIAVPTYLILNDVNMKSKAYSYRQYGGGRYGYGYGYANQSREMLPWYKRIFKKKD